MLICALCKRLERLELHCEVGVGVCAHQNVQHVFQEAAALLEAFLGTQCERFHNPCDMCHEALALLIIAIAVLLRCVQERVLELLHVVLADYDPAKLPESCGQVARCILATQDYTCTT